MSRRNIQYFLLIQTMISSCLGNKYTSSMTRALRGRRSMTGRHFTPFFATNTCHPADIPFASTSQPCCHCSSNTSSTILHSSQPSLYDCCVFISCSPPEYSGILSQSSSGSITRLKWSAKRASCLAKIVSNCLI